MKIAMFDPNLRICGPVVSMMHLKKGFERLGHQADVVALTKSGRASIHWVDDYTDAPLGCGWSMVVPDRTVKQKDAGDVFDDYDFIVISDPRCAYPDKIATKEGELPNYIQWLAATKTPFSFPLNGNRYEGAAAPFLKELVSLPNFVGYGVDYGLWEDHRGGDPTGALEQFGWADLHLPFAVETEAPTHLECTQAVGMTGRLTPNKGQQIAALLPMIRQENIELWGACSKGLGASFSYDIWERLAEAGYEQVWRGGPPKHTPLNPFPWTATYDGSTVQYRGNYSGDAPYPHFDVQMSITNPNFSKINLEYVVLEAVAAGKKLVINDHFWDGELRCARLRPDIAPKSPKMIIKKHQYQLEQASEGVDIARALTVEDLQWNLDYIRRVYDPTLSARAYLEGPASAL